MTDTDRYATLDWLVTLYTKLRAELELSHRLNPRDDDVSGEIDFLSDHIAELERERDGAPLEAILSEQAREDARDRDWFQRGVV